MAANTLNSLTVLMTTAFSSPKASKLVRFCTPSSPLDTAFPSRRTLRLRQRSRRLKRGDSILVRAGPPSSSTLILAFVLPLSLLIGTILVSIRIADDLDEKFVKELLMNEAMAQEEAYEDDDGEAEDEEEYDEEEDGESADERRMLELEEAATAAAAAPRVRNRPKKEI